MEFETISTILAWTMIAGACVVLATRERRSGGAVPLGAVLVVSGLVGTLAPWGWSSPESLPQLTNTVVLLEASLPFIWFFYALNFVGLGIRKLSVPALVFWAVGFLALVSMGLFVDPSNILFNPDYGVETILFMGSTGFYFYLLLTIYLIAALVTLERSFAGMVRQDRWRVKFEVIGMGAIISVQIVFYSQTLMYRALDFALNPARDIAIAVGVCLFLYARFYRGYPEKISVSPGVVYRSLVLLAVSFYLIFMGLVGEGLKFFGPTSNRVFVLVLALVCGVGVCIACLSETLRRKVQVFIHKHFYEHRYNYRDKWLEMTDRLSTAADEPSLCKAILEMYCQTFALQGGALYLRQSRPFHLIPVATYEWSNAPESISIRGSLVSFLQDKRWVFNALENSPELATSQDARIFEDPPVQFVVPLFFNDRVEGLILLGHQINKDEPVIYEDYDLMKTLANQSSYALHNLRLSEQLADAREMAAIGKVSTFVMHDLKNLVSNLALVVDNAKDHIDDREFQKDMVETLNNSVSRMKGLIDRLTKLEVVPQLRFKSCDLKRLVEETLRNSIVGDFEVKGTSVDLIIDRQEIARVILNLVKNGLEAMGDNGGVVEIETGVDGRAFLTVKDKGCGMTEEFIDGKLFKPFETTKTKGFGVGLYQCRQIVEAHGGEIEIRSKPGEGSTFTVWLPMVQE